MYHNENGVGYIAMSAGTAVPRDYQNPVYFVLYPNFLNEGDLFLTRNGVILTYQRILPEHSIKKDQFPTIATNILHKGQGHYLPPEMTGGKVIRLMSSEDLRKEKGDFFEPGKSLPSFTRKTPWEFISQKTPPNYAKLFFSSSPITKEEWQHLWEMSNKGKEEAKEKESEAKSSRNVQESKVSPVEEEINEEKGSSLPEEVLELMQIEEEEAVNDTEASSIKEMEVESKFITRAKSSRGADNPWML